MESGTNLAVLLNALEERNTFVESILQNIPIGIAVNKIDDGKTIVINKRFSEIYGWPESDLSDVSNFFKNLYPDEAYRNEIMGKVMCDIQSGDPARMAWDNITITTCCGEKRVINAKNIPLYDQNLMISTVMDVTNEHKQAAEIRRTKANQDALINGIEDMIWSVDPNLNLIAANDAFLEIMEAVTGKIVREGEPVLQKEFGEERLDKWRQYYERALKGERFTVNAQPHNPAHQTIRYSVISLSPMVNEAGTIFGVACHSKDVTQDTFNILALKQNELRIMQQNEQLMEIALINAHEIRRPVASILGLVHLLKDTNETEPTRELLQYLEMAANELDTIIKRIVDKTSA